MSKFEASNKLEYQYRFVKESYAQKTSTKRSIKDITLANIASFSENYC